MFKLNLISVYSLPSFLPCLEQSLLRDNIHEIDIHKSIKDTSKSKRSRLSLSLNRNKSNLENKTEINTWIKNGKESLNIDHKNIILNQGKICSDISDAKPKRRHGAAYLTHTKTAFFLANIYDSATNKKGLFYINR